MASLRAYRSVLPRCGARVYIDPGATVIGDVELGPEVSIWYSAVLRGDAESITVGAGSNVQDGCVMHADPGFPARVGSNVVVGHRAVLHGCTVEDGALVGMGAIVLNGATIGAGSLDAAGTVVPQGFVVPPGTMIAGVPGKIRRELTEDEINHNRINGQVYEHLLTLHRG